MKISTQDVVPAEQLATPAYGHLAPVDLTGPVDEVWTQRETDVSKMGFQEYVEAVDGAMLRHWRVDTFDAQVDPDALSDALDQGVSPTEFALRWGSANAVSGH
ncbi:hypothetical protein HUE56_29640 (plasmid) [Azospirillum oryzae]|uniref:Uncharacterized protein n=1 Tax=Azospirillum oryzae TaxID=286727 RepID=A0A6N1AST4_9PROT|nr:MULTISPECIES: hypothetical protein [Azospirillum]QKS54666.1 hypothetical protein HUE56_29640 [Azospirillum oryzae]GLR77555.1 hypothetical protein GCM10007856_02230 [Azospirillum oryzae]